MLQKLNISKKLSYAGVGSILKVIAAFGIQKILAVTIGPSGLALVNQFQNFASISVSLSAGGINTGVTKYTSEYFSKDKGKLNSLLSTSKTITLILSLIISITIFLFSSYLSNYLFKSDDYTVIIKISAVSTLFFAANELITSYLTGLSSLKEVVKGSLLRSVLTLFLGGGLAYNYGAKGAMVGIALMQIVAFLYYIKLLLSNNNISLSNFTNAFDKAISSKVFKYSLVAIVSAVLLPMVSILIREHIVTKLSINDAGIWDALNKLSLGYMGIVSTSVSLYYLPRISSIEDKKVIIKELKHGISLFVLIIGFGIGIFYVFSDFFILLLFSKDFLEMKNILLPFFIGDIFKVTFIVSGITLLAKAKIKDFVFIQLTFTVLNFLLAYFLIDYFSLIGASYAHLIRTFLRAIVTFTLVYKFLYNDR